MTLFFLVVITMGGGGLESRVVDTFAKPSTCREIGKALSKNPNLRKYNIKKIQCVPVKINIS